MTVNIGVWAGGAGWGAADPQNLGNLDFFGQEEKYLGKAKFKEVCMCVCVLLLLFLSFFFFFFREVFPILN